MKQNGISNNNWEAFTKELAECYAKLGCTAIQASKAIQHITEALNGLPRPETEDIPVPQNEIGFSNFLNQIIPDPELLEIEEGCYTLTEITDYIKNEGYELYG